MSGAAEQIKFLENKMQERANIIISNDAVYARMQGQLDILQQIPEQIAVPDINPDGESRLAAQAEE